MASNRSTTRDQVVSLLEAALVGTGLPVKTVSGSKQNTLEGNTPLVIVHSAGSGRDSATFQGNVASFHFLLQVWVLQTATDWTAAQAIDAVDEIESLIAGTAESNRNTDNWGLIKYDGITSVTEIEVAGVPYYVEEIPIVVNLTRS